MTRSLVLSHAGPLLVDLPSAPRAPSPMRFDEAARRVIGDALATSGGRIYGPTGAAAILGLKPTTLVSKMQRLGVASQDRARTGSTGSRSAPKRSPSSRR